jgi:hypothetical protein
VLYKNCLWGTKLTSKEFFVLVAGPATHLGVSAVVVLEVLRLQLQSIQFERFCFAYSHSAILVWSDFHSLSR